MPLGMLGGVGGVDGVGGRSRVLEDYEVGWVDDR